MAFTNGSGLTTTQQPWWVYDIATANTTNITTTTMGTILATKKSPLLSYETKIILEFIIHIGLFYTTAVLGVIVNIINIIVYRKQGLRDSITIGLFALSVSDLFVSGLTIETATCYSLKFIFPNSNIQYVSVHYVHSSWSRRMFYSFSCMVTALLSIERCLCVILPFKVKVIFTKSRTAIFVISLVIIHILCFVPIFATHQLRWRDNPSAVNGSDSKILGLWFAPYRDVIESFNSTLMAIVTPTLAQVIVTCCAAVMIHGLRQASKFRQHATTSTSQTNTQSTKNELDDTNTSQNNVPSNQNRNSAAVTLSPRDARLVRTMVFIVAILSACNIPYLIMTYAILAVHDLNIHRPYHNTYSLIFSINYVLSNLNASLNFLIYYKTSTKYREVFDQIFSRVKNIN